jgi:hypothetical protein
VRISSESKRDTENVVDLLRCIESAARERSRELRTDQSANVRRRRAVVGLSSLGAASLGLIRFVSDWDHQTCLNHLCPTLLSVQNFSRPKKNLLTSAGAAI